MGGGGAQKDPPQLRSQWQLTAAGGGRASSLQGVVSGTLLVLQWTAHAHAGGTDDIQWVMKGEE